MRPLRAGIIGLGVGEAHIAGYAGHPECEVAVLCDCRPEKLEEVSTRHPGIALRSRAEDVLDDPDIDMVSIATYDNCHHGQIVRALEHDKHVFVEKPLCLSEAEARDIRARLAARPHLKLSSNLILRRCPRFVALKRRIDDGAMGELFLVEGDYHYGRLQKITEGWRGQIEYYSVVHGGAIHLVDLLVWLTGERVVEVFAAGNGIATRGSQFRFNDMVVSTLRFASGLVGRVGVSYGCVRPHFHGLSVYGTRATFVNGVPSGWLYTSRDPQVPPEEVADAYPGVQKGDLIGSFVDSILHDSAPLVDKEDVFRTMSVCLAIEESSRTGKVCPVQDV